MAQIWNLAWRSLYSAQSYLVGRVVTEVGNACATRGNHGRVGADDGLFASLTTAMAISMSKGDFDYAKRLFGECYRTALCFEDKRTGCAIHKGAPTFNVGIAFLRSYDFAAAMHYFELAQEETRLTTGHVNWNVYLSDLFRRNFWDTVGLAFAEHPNRVYKSLWRDTFDDGRAIADWKDLSQPSKLSYIIALAQRNRLKQLVSQARWGDSDAVAIAYSDLTSTLSRILETETRFFSAIDSTFGPMLMQGFKTNGLGNISAGINQLHGHYLIKDIRAYNRYFKTLRRTIANPGKLKKVRIENALYLLYATRNQIAHSLDRRLILYQQRDALLFVVDMMFALCRLDEWVL